jgi:hypothetical protein
MSTSLTDDDATSFPSDRLFSLLNPAFNFMFHFLQENSGAETNASHSDSLSFWVEVLVHSDIKLRQDIWHEYAFSSFIYLTGNRAITLTFQID